MFLMKVFAPDGEPFEVLPQIAKKLVIEKGWELETFAEKVVHAVEAEAVAVKDEVVAEAEKVVDVVETKLGIKKAKTPDPAPAPAADPAPAPAADPVPGPTAL